MSQHPVDISVMQTFISRIFSSAPLSIENALGGISTSVYRVIYPNDTFYLRLLPDAHDSFASEVAVHTQLHQMQVKVPEVIFYTHFDEVLQRSVMITTAIKGIPVIQSQFLGEDVLRTIVEEAGRDLAKINTIAVNGFGRLRSHVETEQLEASYSTYRTFALADWDSSMRFLASTVLSASEVSLLKQLINHYDAWLKSEWSYLAHGDFSSRHIFQEGGHYTGIIDFGDSKGAIRWYDLGYFHMRDGGPLLPHRLEPALLSGYREIVSLPPTYESHIRFTSILITVSALAYTLQRHPPDRFTQHQLKTLRHDLTNI